MLKGKPALITGSTSGIGLGIAKRFASGGANIVLNGFGDAADALRDVRHSGFGRLADGVNTCHHAADIQRRA